MNPKKLALAAAAVVLVILMVVVWRANLDGLPRDLRAEVRQQQAAYTAAQRQFQAIRDEVNRTVRAEPALFSARNMSVVLPERLNRAELALRAAGNDVTALERLNQSNRKRDRQKIELLLHNEEKARQEALQQAAAVQAEVRRWVAFKKDLPGSVRQMENEYKALQGADLANVTATVQKAAADWPAKKGDLENRLGTLRAAVAEADNQWEVSAPLRAKASTEDAPALAAAADAIHDASDTVKSRAETLRNLTGQLYTAYDKVLVDLEKEGDYTYKEKLKTVTTKFTDVAANKTEMSTAEAWVQVPPETYRRHEQNLGMTVEHKAAGKYDSEADKVAQPPGFGYMARPEEGRNRYGYWNMGGPSPVWIWYPAFSHFGSTFWGPSYYGPSVNEYRNYSTARSTGQTYYGVDSTSNRPKWGTASDGTAQRYGSSKYVSSGTYKSSKYQSGGSTATGTRFGSGGSTATEGSRYRSGGSTSYRSSPSRPSSSGSGRRYGGRR